MRHLVDGAIVNQRDPRNEKGRASPRPPIVRSRPICSTTATKGREVEVKKFYQFLADWEKQHLEALRTLYNSVRTDFFAAGSFSPF